MDFVPSTPFKEQYQKAFVQTYPNGERFVVLSNSKQGSRKIALARYRLSVSIGQELPEDVEVDFKDGDSSNCRPDNLRPVITDAHREHVPLFGRRLEVMVKLSCPVCQASFVRTERYLRDKRSQGQKEFFCGHSCQSKKQFAPKRRISEEQKQKIKALRARKWTSYQISDELKIARNTVMRYW